MNDQLFFNDKDAYTEYGIILAEGAVSALICPSPAKAYVQSSSRLENGRRYFTDYFKEDERTLSLPFFIRANDKETMFENLDKFAREVLYQGDIALRYRISATLERTHQLVFKSCTQMQDFNGRSGKFTLQVVEPNPANRT